MKKHFVNFLSPGTFFAEKTTKEIHAWDIEQAVKLSRDVVERYGARPYGFYFTTRERSEKDLDSHETARSGTYYLGGIVLTLEQIVAREDPDDRILIANMRSNGYDRVITGQSPWEWSRPFMEGDVVLELEGA